MTPSPPPDGEFLGTATKTSPIMNKLSHGYHMNIQTATVAVTTTWRGYGGGGEESRQEAMTGTSVDRHTATYLPHLITACSLPSRPHNPSSQPTPS